MDAFTRSFLLLFVLLNPFILSVYLVDIVRHFDAATYRGAIVKAGVVSAAVFCLFAAVGDSVFENLLQVRFSSFLIFGGVVFLVVGIRLIAGQGPGVISVASSDESSAAIAMPLMIGPGTISASVLAGSRLDLGLAFLAIVLALAAAVVSLLVFKYVHDWVRRRHEPLVRRYVEIVGRATALFVGSFAIEMIMNGINSWLEVFRNGS
jgi:multiple antibiotic resistance protein